RLYDTVGLGQGRSWRSPVRGEALQLADVGAGSEEVDRATAVVRFCHLPQFVEDRRGADVVDMADHEDLTEVFAGRGDCAEHVQQSRATIAVERAENFVQHEETGWMRSLAADHS